MQAIHAGAPSQKESRTALETPAALVTTWPSQYKSTRTEKQRLPAFGRQLRDALEAGYLPGKLGGGVLVTSSWNTSRGCDPARVVAPPTRPACSYDFRFLRGLEVVVLVPASDEAFGQELRSAVATGGASLAVLAVNRGSEA